MNAENKKHPRQPLIIDAHGVVRFKANEIVRYLLDTHPYANLNNLALMPFKVEDRRQLAQLIGYSESGYDDLTHALHDNGYPDECPE